MILCVAVPNLALRAALGDPFASPPDAPVALGDSVDRARSLIEQVNPAARRAGLSPGMRISSALDLCPGLVLVPPNGPLAKEAWEEVLTSLESLGAAIETDRPGEAFFEAGPLLPMHGGWDSLIRAIFVSSPGGIELGAGSTRLAAATSIAPVPEGIEPVGPDRLTAHLDGLPIEVLEGRLSGPVEREEMFGILEKLGVGTLGELRALPRGAISDRFGHAGLRAHDLASGLETPLSPRLPSREIRVSLDLAGEDAGDRAPVALRLACGLLSNELERAGLAARKVSLEVEMEDGGGVGRDFVPRSPIWSSETITLLLEGAVDALPGLARALSLEAGGLTRAAPRQERLFRGSPEDRQRRLEEASRQADVAAGDEALLRVVEIDPGSRLPERRMLLVPRRNSRG